jgi:hypothetical protein
LAEAIGPCGLAVENGDAGALAAGVAQILGEGELMAGMLGGAAAHLALHTRRHAVGEYLRLISPVPDRSLA